MIVKIEFADPLNMNMTTLIAARKQAQSDPALGRAIKDRIETQIAVDCAAERQSAAIREAIEWLRVGAPGRAAEALERALP